ncbi:hypothetical protein Tco_0848108 [Tanacetum coccineum]
MNRPVWGCDKKQSRRNAQSYFPTRYEDTDINSFHHDKSRVLDYPHYSDDAKIDAYYDLPPLLPCFKLVQPYAEYRCESSYESLKEDTNYMLNYEQGINDHVSYDTPDTTNSQHEDEELSSDDDIDDWLEAEMEKCKHGQKEENKEDVLIAILKSLVGECKAVFTNKSAQPETSLNGINEDHERPLVTNKKDSVHSGTLPCQLPPKELSPESFTLPCTMLWQT